MEELVSIDALDDDGRGVGRRGGLEVHVAGALPGETVRARIAHRSPHAPRAWADLLGLAGPPADERVVPACPAHGSCGGCTLQHLAYPAQLTAKRQLIERSLAEHPSTAGLEVADVIASAHEIHYRNKAKYVVGEGPGAGLIFGSYAPGSHRVVDMAGCQVPEDPIDEVAHHLRRLLETERLAAFDERARTGELRYVIVRRNAGGELLVVIVAASTRAAPALARAARSLVGAAPAVRGVVLHVNDARSGAIFDADAPSDTILAGTDVLAETVGDVRLELSARAFFQINRQAAARLYAQVAALAGARSGLHAIDLYSGVGGIALLLAGRGAEVVGVEALAAAVSSARHSAETARLSQRARFLAADAAEGLPAAHALLGTVDVLVVNPPRKGLSDDARAAIRGAAPPRIIYVSCGPRSLAGDLAGLIADGYRVSVVQPFDLLPGTPHVETVVQLDFA